MLLYWDTWNKGPVCYSDTPLSYLRTCTAAGAALNVLDLYSDNSVWISGWTKASLCLLQFLQANTGTLHRWSNDWRQKPLLTYHEYDVSLIWAQHRNLNHWNICTKIHVHDSLNLLKPTGHVTHQQFNIQQLYVLPTLCLCVLYLSENKQRLVPLTA